jgi:hypothetical protein
MEERSNKTIMCSVLFLDIVEYSRKPVAGQISLKDRFNNYLSIAIRDVPITDRIILDTGDGAAINFLGDVEDALKAALSLRESLLGEDTDEEHPLLIRMGINLGPVRLVRDINGQPNIVGDGINVAQRVMGFADVAQILVSRSYYDAVSRLSPQYAGMFHYQGSRTDKHVREHEVYAIGYPGDKTTLKWAIKSAHGSPGHAEGFLSDMKEGVQAIWYSAVSTYRKAQPAQRVMYVGGVISVPLLLLLLASLMSHNKIPVQPKDTRQQAENAIASTAPADPGIGKASAVPPKPVVTEKPDIQHAVAIEKPKSSPRHKPKKTPDENHIKDTLKDKSAPSEQIEKPRNQEVTTKRTVSGPSSGGSAETRISVACTTGSEVFVDGVRKGSVGSGPLIVEIPSGAHTVIVSQSSGGIYSQSVNLESGTTVQIKPNFCK